MIGDDETRKRHPFRKREATGRRDSDVNGREIPIEGSRSSPG
jgi:hypothetical protein